MTYEVPVELWMLDHRDLDHDEAPCDNCLDSYGEVEREIDGTPFLLCEDCEPGF